MNAVTKKSSIGARCRLGGAVLVLVAAFSLGGASIALGASGGSAASDAYAKPAKVVVAGASNGSASTPSKGTTLPFTGVSLIWPAIGAIALVSLGLGLRRHERKNS